MLKNKKIIMVIFAFFAAIFITYSTSMVNANKITAENSKVEVKKEIREDNNKEESEKDKNKDKPINNNINKTKKKTISKQAKIVKADFIAEKFNGALPSEIKATSETGYYKFITQKNKDFNIAYGTPSTGSNATKKGWYFIDENTSEIEDSEIYTISDVEKVYTNLGINEFKQSSVDPGIKPEFYGNARIIDEEDTINGPINLWSFSDKDDANKVYYRVWGDYKGVEGFYESDKYGNVDKTPKKADLNTDRDKAPKNGEIAEDLVSDAAYISSLQVKKISDGVAPWDGDSKPGNDANDSNKIVRSFDSIRYDIEYITKVQNQNYGGFKNGKVYVEFELNADPREALFDTDAMSWLNEAKTVYKVDNNTYTKIEDARSAAGSTKQVMQVLTGYRKLSKTDGSEVVIPGTGSLSAVVSVQAAPNNKEIKPKFTVYTEGNNPDPTVNNEHGYPEARQVKPDIVKVSAAPMYNLKLSQNTAVDYKTNYDLSTGKVNAINIDKGIVHGRMQGYELVMEMHNQNPNKKLKGMELPHGKINFDLEMGIEAKNPSVSNSWEDITNKNFMPGDGDPLNYYDRNGEGYRPMPILWDYKISNEELIGSQGRNLVNTTKNSTLPFSGVIESRKSEYEHAAFYKGGDINVRQINNILTFELDSYLFQDKLIRGKNYPTHVFNKGIQDTPDFGEERVVFSGVSIQVLMPLPKYDALTNNSVNFRQKFEDKNLNVKSISNQQLKKQTKLDDDKIVDTLVMFAPGIYSKNIWTGGQTIGENQSNLGRGDSWSAIGGQFRITSGIEIGATNEEEDYAFGYNNFVKFDSSQLEVVAGQNEKSFTHWEGNSPKSKLDDVNVLYAGRIKGWDNESQIQTIRENDVSLKYFKTIDQLNNAGFTCVGFLFEARGDKIKSAGPGYQSFNSPKLRVRDDAQSGYVSMMVNDINLWNKKAYTDAGYKIPSRFNIGSGELPKNSFTMNSSTSNVYKYTKAIYDDFGYAGGHEGSYKAGNSLLVVSSQVNISKEIEQKTIGQTKKSFDIGSNQRIVDYVLSPKIMPIGGNSNAGNPTTVTITDKLPVGLSYIPGSANIGGTYVPNNDPNKQGSVAGGVQEEPTIKANTDGSTTLTWAIQGVIPGKAIDKIHYSADIGDVSGATPDVVNGQQLVNEATISAPEDMRTPTIANGKKAQEGISIIKLRDASLVKMVNPSMYEIEQTVKYKVSYSNIGDNKIDDMIILDKLPYNGDKRGSNFDGTYQLENDIELAGSGKNNMKIYYTTDPIVRNKTAKNYSSTSITSGVDGWIAANEVSAAKFNIPDTKNITGIVMLGTLNGGQNISMPVHLATKDNKPGNIYANDATMVPSGTPDENVEAAIVRARTVDRVITGVMWEDKDNDGKRVPGEKLFKDVRVSLLSKDATGNFVQAKDIFGNDVATVLSDANGRYEFDNLAAGEYKVMLSGSSNFKIEKYLLTKYKVAGISTTFNSDGQVNKLNGFNELESVYIDDIKLPELADMKVYRHVEASLDSGFYNNKDYYTKYDMNVKKVWDDNLDLLKKRPDSIKVQLYADGKAMSGDKYIKTLSDATGWKAEWKALKLYSNEDAKTKIKYTVKEVSVPKGYEDSYKMDAHGNITVMNYLKPTPEIKKDVEGKQSIKIDRDQEFNWNVKFNFGNNAAKFKYAYVEDKVNDLLEIKDVRVLDSKAKDVTNIEGKLTIKGQNIKYEFAKKNGSYAYLSGKSYTMVVTNKLKKDVSDDELKPYYENGIPNQAILKVENKPKKTTKPYVKVPKKIVKTGMEVSNEIIILLGIAAMGSVVVYKRKRSIK